jgi:hypothetical protein
MKLRRGSGGGGEINLLAEIVGVLSWIPRASPKYGQVL